MRLQAQLLLKYVPGFQLVISPCIFRWSFLPITGCCTTAVPPVYVVCNLVVLVQVRYSNTIYVIPIHWILKSTALRWPMSSGFVHPMPRGELYKWAPIKEFICHLQALLCPQLISL